MGSPCGKVPSFEVSVQSILPTTLKGVQGEEWNVAITVCPGATRWIIQAAGRRFHSGIADIVSPGDVKGSNPPAARSEGRESRITQAGSAKQESNSSMIRLPPNERASARRGSSGSKFIFRVELADNPNERYGEK
jgi:hypothetical protein